MQAFREAGAKKDIPAMEKALESLEGSEAAARYLPSLKMDLLIAKEDWAGIEAGLKDLSGDPMGRMMVAQTASRAARDENAPEGFRKAVAAELSKTIEKEGQPYEYQLLSRLRWSLGEKEAALAAAKRSAETAKAAHAKNAKFPLAPYERFAGAVEKGEMPTDRQIGEWTREAMKAAAAEKKEG